MLNALAVSKRYGGQLALEGATFELERGSVLAVIGPNGAGKSTLIRCVLGLIRFEGRVTVDGIDVSRKGSEARSRIGYLAQSPAFHPELTVAETAALYADLRRVPMQRAMESVEAMGMGEQAAKRVGALSGGMRQRLALAVALMADPPLLVLDEPVAGLDIAARLDLRRLIQEQRDAGRSILLSTHWIEDVPYVADRALVLEQGKTAFLGPATLLAGSAAPPSTLFLRLNGRGPDAIPLIEEVTAPRAVKRRGDWLVVSCRADDKAKVVERLVSAGVHVLDFRVEEAPIDAMVFGADRATEDVL